MKKSEVQTLVGLDMCARQGGEKIPDISLIKSIIEMQYNVKFLKDRDNDEFIIEKDETTEFGFGYNANIRTENHGCALFVELLQYNQIDDRYRLRNEPIEESGRCIIKTGLLYEYCYNRANMHNYHEVQISLLRRLDEQKSEEDLATDIVNFMKEYWEGFSEGQ
ncbi:MAG: hypothetical protein NZ774_01830 [Candidatus Poseidoniales archaeon]|nr:hypothetical protein [Candidatus Poseidoniales archaeon]